MTEHASSAAVRDVAAAIAEKAQAVYDAWQQDEEGIDEVYGAGGICDDVAATIAEELDALPGVDARTQYVEVDCHTHVVAAFADGVFGVDIPPGVYERGTGYVWRKIDGVKFEPDHLVVARLSPDPADLPMFCEMDDEAFAP